LASGEDRGFAQALALMDARIRHDPTIVVTTSGRIDGRAPGGMADTIRRRIQRQDEFTDANLEPAIDAFRRIDFRRRARDAWRSGGDPPRDLAADLGVPYPRLQAMLTNRYFGTAWSDIETVSPLLVRRRVRFSELPQQIAYAHSLLVPPVLAEVVP
jgi:hypothetical protein